MGLGAAEDRGILVDRLSDQRVREGGRRLGGEEVGRDQRVGDRPRSRAVELGQLGQLGGDRSTP
jgi:hypothetical protein